MKEFRPLDSEPQGSDQQQEESYDYLRGSRDTLEAALFAIIGRLNIYTEGVDVEPEGEGEEFFAEKIH